jgi:hypothetical protein
VDRRTSRICFREGRWFQVFFPRSSARSNSLETTTPVWVRRPPLHDLRRPGTCLRKATAGPRSSSPVGVKVRPVWGTNGTSILAIPLTMRPTRFAVLP